MKSLLAIGLLAFSITASAAQMFKCSLTHNIDSVDADPKVEIISRDAAVLDMGKTFTFSTDGKNKITSPELQPVKAEDGETVLAAKRNNLLFVKLKNSYVLRNEKEGYVFGECAPDK
ncbi:hypothetical protein [Pantoea sp. ACRSB]|uniref:hypothetical protein n=1 Tax=Pantoea sp. ACRSB TaxID=2918207 RepID=UPI002892B3A5|nr:hypothetical protein [Pantoea sp. ACRSB]MCG7388748.1 hypothetical protein [Pantoea sp. ACRSB]